MSRAVRRYLSLREQKERLENELAEVNRELAQTEGAVLDEWVEEGKNKEAVEGQTLYFERRLRVNTPLRRMPQVAALCERLGWTDCIRTSRWIDAERLEARLRAAMGEALDESQIPPELKQAAGVFVQTGLRVRKAGKSVSP